MLEAVIWIIILIASLFLLIKSSDYFTRSAEIMGMVLGLPSFIIGVTIVAVGTSLPEVASSIFAVLKNSSEIVVGNVIGSNIANIFLVLGLAALFSKKTQKIEYKSINIDLLFLVVSATLLSITIWNRAFILFEAVLFIAIFIIYLIYTIKKGKSQRIEIKDDIHKESVKKHILILVITSVFIYLGAEYTINSVIRLSDIFNIGTELIAASVISLGTSLPELTVSIIAARRGKIGLAVGNVLGSNIFNTFMVMGIAGLFGALLIPASIIYFALPMMIIATLIYFFIIRDKKIENWEGVILLILYVFFIGKLFNFF